ncbi:FAR1-related sequence 5-like protein [Tanacetum coccineum]
MYVPNFTFQYRVENSESVAVFYADKVAKCNYKEFGDIVSFDATFNNNNDSSRISCDSSGIPLNLLRFHFNLMRFYLNLMYNMKFVPLIGIDNHGKCVTLGLRMLLHEDTKSYTWLLNAFMTAFSHEPTMIVTDQDGSMKRAIEAVFKKVKHRLCMWHIMQKNSIKAYFIDSSLYGLMRTTSRSESEKSFFKSFTIPRATLVSFMMSYESAMERQRYRQEALDFKTIEAAPKCETKLEIELHASHV